MFLVAKMTTKTTVTDITPWQDVTVNSTEGLKTGHTDHARTGSSNAVVFLSFVCTGAILANILVLVTVGLTRQLRTLNYVFIISLVVTDLLLAALVTAPYIYCLSTSAKHVVIHIRYFSYYALCNFSLKSR